MVVGEVVQNIQDSIIDNLTTQQQTGLNVKKVEEILIVEFADVNFKYNSAKLLTSAKASLKTIGEVLKQYPDINIQINGYTDNTDKKDYNLKLSRERAYSVFMYMIDSGFITEIQAVYKGFGETSPVTSNKTLAGRKKNRRVEILISAED